jgi:hypothetical protein
MIRIVTRWWLPLVMVCVLLPSPAAAQLALRPSLQTTSLQATSQTGVIAQGELHGVVQDDRGIALAGAVVSALGSTTAFAVSDRDGQFLFRSLPYGPYLLRAHLQGYVPARARVVQVNGNKNTWTLALSRADAEGAPSVLAAGVGGSSESTPPDSATDVHDHDEVAWRLRHLKRSVLKDEIDGVVASDEWARENPLAGVARSIGVAARGGAGLFSDLPFSGQINLLTTTSFDRPQELFSINAGVPQGVAYVSLVAPMSDGDWTVRGTLTEGDVSSWIVAGSYARRAGATHRYEAGLSYSMQRYLGGNSEALTAVRDGGRNVGSLYAYDDWSLGRRMHVGYGGKYASYDYLTTNRGLFSPRVSVSVQPIAGDSLRVRTAVSHREIAPGAEEFIPPTVGLWLPPERTFSAVGHSAFLPERLDHYEVGVDREWARQVIIGVRAFRQDISDQIVTLFGRATGVATDMGHYVVGSAGDVQAFGWGATASRDVGDRLRASVDYMESNTQRTSLSPSERRLGRIAPAVLRGDETIRSVTASVQSIIPVTSTRLLVVYRVSNAFADAITTRGTASRFDVQMNQSLPFLNFTNSQWELLVAVRNMFREDLFDGSVYDELLVVRPPKRVLGGVTVRF